jgi:hypothetical protein
VDEQETGIQDEVLDDNGKPFWMKFLKDDYLGEKDTKRAE